MTEGDGRNARKFSYHRFHSRGLLVYASCDRQEHRAHAPLSKIPHNLIDALAMDRAIQASAGGVDARTFVRFQHCRDRSNGW